MTLYCNRLDSCDKWLYVHPARLGCIVYRGFSTIRSGGVYDRRYALATILPPSLNHLRSVK